MDLQIVNPDPKYSTVKLIESTTLGYIHVAAEVRPRPVPFMPNGRDKSALLTGLKRVAHHVEQLEAVEKVTILDAIAFAPPSSFVKERGDATRAARFDIVALIETTSPAAARDVQGAPACRTLVDGLRRKARRMHIVVARNARRVGDVDKATKGLFLFNYFVADDAREMLELWDYLAGWWEVETGLDNSTLLVPLEGERSEYRAINNARWDGSPLRLMARQVSKKNFRSYMLANLAANRVGAMPILYRLA